MDLAKIFQVPKIKPTFCGLLAFALRKGLHAVNSKDEYDRRDFEIVQSWNNAYGVVMKLRDKVDGQEYQVEIKPAKGDTQS